MQIPYFTLREMESSLDLQAISNAVESALCRLRLDYGNEVDDRVVARLLELLLDRYHFREQGEPAVDPLLTSGFRQLSGILREELNQEPDEVLVKVLGTVYRSVQRRTCGGCEYLDFIGELVGVRVADGVRLLAPEERARENGKYFSRAPSDP